MLARHALQEQNTYLARATKTGLCQRKGPTPYFGIASHSAIVDSRLFTAQLSTLVGVWASALQKHAEATDTVFGRAGSNAPLLVALGGMRYVNKAQCTSRDLSCYFEPFSACEAPESARTIRAAKTPMELASRISSELRLRRKRSKWWLRKELMRYVLRPNNRTVRMLNAVRSEMGLSAPRMLNAVRGEMGLFEPSKSAVESGVNRLHTNQLVGIHIRRGDKRDLGAKERGEPFSDAMYSKAALALAREVGAAGFLLASSEPETLTRLPPLLAPLPTFIMPAHHFVAVPEGRTPHQVVEQTRQASSGNDEGRSQVVQWLLLAECRAFLGTATSNFGQVVTKMLGFRQPTPIALDLSCEGLTPMADDDKDVSVTGAWRLQWDAHDKVRCRGLRRREKVPPRRSK